MKKISILIIACFALSCSSYSIHQAAFDGDIKKINGFIYYQSRDIDEKAKDFPFQTPLMFAVYGGHSEAVKHILGFGADVNAKDENGYTALDIALIEKKPNIETILKIYGASNSDIYLAIKKQQRLNRKAKEEKEREEERIARQRKFVFIEKEYDNYTDIGNETISGQAFAKTKGGDVKYGAGVEIQLIPFTPYTLEDLSRRILNNEDLLPQLDKRLIKYIRIAVTDAFGNFSFSELPQGKYILWCPIYWKVASEYGLETTGSDAYATVTITKAWNKRIVVTLDGFEY